MDQAIIAGAIITIAGAGGAWLKAHEQRISATEAVVQKLDKLVDLMLEEKLAQREAKTNGKSA